MTKLTLSLSIMAALLTGCGADGLNGGSCHVKQNSDGTATVSCDDGTTATVTHGTDGKDGLDSSPCTVTQNPDDSARILCPDGTTALVGAQQDQCPLLNRAELIKMVITAIDGLANYEAPKTPTYSDVRPDMWYYDYVESATQLGLISGYTDASGNLTSQFGPNDQVSRAETLKIMVIAFNFQNFSTGSEPPFTDVVPGSWYYDYVKSAYNAGVINSTKDSLLHPANWADRCWTLEAFYGAKS